MASTAISRNFPTEDALLGRPTAALVGLLAAAGLLCFAAVRGLSQAAGRDALAWIILVGAILQVVMFPTTSILDDDAYRYLWDGAVLAHGTNPYAFSPDDALRCAENPRAAPTAPRELALESEGIVSA